MRGLPRYLNRHANGSCVFLTTTVLGFTPVFRRPVVAETLLIGIFEDCRFHDIALYGFVVMPEHVHLLLRLPPILSVSQVMNRMKAAAANRCLPLLTGDESARLAEDPQSVQRALWQRSFRSFPCASDQTFQQKLRYLHCNPVRRELCERAGEYPYSSARFYEMDPVPGSEDLGLDTAALETHFPVGRRYDLKTRSYI